MVVAAEPVRRDQAAQRPARHDADVQQLRHQERQYPCTSIDRPTASSTGMRCAISAAHWAIRDASHRSRTTRMRSHSTRSLWASRTRTSRKRHADRHQVSSASGSPRPIWRASCLLDRLSDGQWQDAFRAGGYAPDVAQRFIRTLENKVAAGRRLGSTPAWTPASGIDAVRTRIATSFGHLRCGVGQRRVELPRAADSSSSP